jgi:hypothetical protein|tara:strand:- start:174 stop:290 length:117 start_codon:yes stop_codon:yes gene_type:complete
MAMSRKTTGAKRRKMQQYGRDLIAFLKKSKEDKTTTAS